MSPTNIPQFACHYCNSFHTSGSEKTQCWKRFHNSQQEAVLPRIDNQTPTAQTPKIETKKTKVSVNRKLTRSEKESLATERKRNPSAAEKSLMTALKRLSKKGYHFKREVKIAGYYVDFYLEQAKLIVEVDGKFHRHQPLNDARRDGILSAMDYSILRFTAYEVLNNPGDVVTKIESWIKRNKGLSRNQILKREVSEDSISPHSHHYVLDDLTISTRPMKAKSNRLNKTVESGLYVCQNCPERNPFKAPLGKPLCYNCNKNSETRLVCLRCKKPFEFETRDPSRVCRECRDYRDVVRSAARGVRDDMTRPRDKSGGGILRPGDNT